MYPPLMDSSVTPNSMNSAWVGSRKRKYCAPKLSSVVVEKAKVSLLDQAADRGDLEAKALLELLRKTSV